MAAAEPAATCRAHPERPAAATCARCGAFVCAECRNPAGLCPDCAARQGTPGGRWQANAAVGMLWLSIASRAVDLFIYAAYSAGLTPRGTEAFLSTLATGAVQVAQVNYYLTAIPFLIWWHSVVERCAARNLNLGATPGEAVLAWFTPFVNLEKPYRLFRAVVTGLGISAPVGWWWAFFIGRTIFAVFASFARSSIPSSVAMASSALFELTTIVAALLCIRVVGAIQEALTRPNKLPPASTPGVIAS
ncbi:MAG: DUF4328 domain-containing protein [Myxococcaceae bacterium]